MLEFEHGAGWRGGRMLEFERGARLARWSETRASRVAAAGEMVGGSNFEVAAAGEVVGGSNFEGGGGWRGGRRLEFRRWRRPARWSEARTSRVRRRSIARLPGGAAHSPTLV
jgi:hypothetical protein